MLISSHCKLWGTNFDTRTIVFKWECTTGGNLFFFFCFSTPFWEELYSNLIWCWIPLSFCSMLTWFSYLEPVAVSLFCVPRCSFGFRSGDKAKVTEELNWTPFLCSQSQIKMTFSFVVWCIFKVTFRKWLTLWPWRDAHGVTLGCGIQALIDDWMMMTDSSTVCQENIP